MNILLDEKLTAKLSGFGVAQAATGGSDYSRNTHVSQSFLKNTLFGASEYLPPEFKQLPELSMKGDVFAFGVVILETCTDMPALDDRREGGKLLVRVYCTNINFLVIKPYGTIENNIVCVVEILNLVRDYFLVAETVAVRGRAR